MSKQKSNSEFEERFGPRLEAIMRNLHDSRATWSRKLGVTVSALSSWFSGKHKPSADNLATVRDLIYKSGQEELITEFNQLCEENLFMITEKFMSYKADDLYEYMANRVRDRIMTDLNVIGIVNREKEDFYEQIASYLNFASNMPEAERTALSRLNLELEQAVYKVEEVDQRIKVLEEVENYIEEHWKKGRTDMVVTTENVNAFSNQELIDWVVNLEEVAEFDTIGMLEIIKSFRKDISLQLKELVGQKMLDLECPEFAGVQLFIPKDQLGAASLMSQVLAGKPNFLTK